MFQMYNFEEKKEKDKTLLICNVLSFRLSYS